MRCPMMTQAQEKSAPERQTLVLRLYIVADAQNSIRALANLAGICRKYLPGCHQLEIVDVLDDPRRILSDGIWMTPTLVKLSPPPVRRIVGNLSDERTVLRALGLLPQGAQKAELPRGNGQRLLIVNDEDAARDPTRHLLQVFGYAPQSLRVP